ncbi:MAG TPA: enoyl-CoA hydratase, partial [Rhodobacteraceae bacterium]|nr:enoyl-CoA hydratase [Paracoccaceae bacterium]
MFGLLLTAIGHSSKIGSVPARIWGCPTPAIRVYRLGAGKAKRMMLTGGKIDRKEAGKFGLVVKSV